MTYTTKNHHQTVQKMRQSINRLDNVMERSRLLTQDITIKNETNQNLNLIIKVQDQQDEFQTNKNQSRVFVPLQSTYTQVISTSRQRLNTGSNSPHRNNAHFQTNEKIVGNSKIEDNYRTNHTKLTEFKAGQYYSTPRIQRKFQPFAQMQTNKPNYFQDRKIIKESKKNDCIQSAVQTQVQKVLKVDNSTETKNQQSQCSDMIGQQSSINAMFPKQNDLSYGLQQKIGQYRNINKTQDNQLENTGHIALPISISQTNIKPQNTFQTFSNQSPQVMSYLRQEISNNHPQINTPFNKDLNKQTINSLQYSNTMSQKNKQTIQWKVQPLNIGYLNNKKYFDGKNQKQQFKKVKTQQRKNKFSFNNTPQTRKNFMQNNRQSSKSRSKQSSYLSKFEIKQNNSDKKQVANDLFLQRKALFLKKLQTNKRIEKQKQSVLNNSARSKSKSHNNTQNINSTFIKRDNNYLQMSPKAKEVSQRLYSRSKQKLYPCDHYQRWSQKAERERFYGIVRQNSFVGKYISKQQQQTLFQSFRRSDDSISTWPMKIVNYTYSKLQKIDVHHRNSTKNSYV